MLGLLSAIVCGCFADVRMGGSISSRQRRRVVFSWFVDPFMSVRGNIEVEDTCICMVLDSCYRVRAQRQKLPMSPEAFQDKHNEETIEVVLSRAFVV